MAQNKNTFQKHYLQLKETTELIFDLLLPKGSSLSDLGLIEQLVLQNKPHEENMLDWAENLIESEKFKDLELNLADPLLLILVVIRQILEEKHHEHDAVTMNIVVDVPTNKI